MEGEDGEEEGAFCSPESQNRQPSVALFKPLNIVNPRVTGVGLKEGQVIRFSLTCLTAHFSTRLQLNLLEIQAKKLFKTTEPVKVLVC